MALDLQLQTLLLHKALVETREDWGGKLVLACGRNSALSGVPAASSIAGAASLTIDSDATAVKTAMRRGEIDFVVNTLDEALRTLKNEIRQHRPLSVGLTMDVAAALNEMVERGVQPDILLIPTGPIAQEVRSYPALEDLTKRGMPYSQAASDPVDGSCEPTLILNQQTYFAHFFAARDASALRLIDTALLKAIPPDNPVRRHWIQRVPQYLPVARTGGRWAWLNEAEIAALAQAELQPTRRLQ